MKEQFHLQKTEAREGKETKASFAKGASFPEGQAGKPVVVPPAAARLCPSSGSWAACCGDSSVGSRGGQEYPCSLGLQAGLISGGCGRI